MAEAAGAGGDAGGGGAPAPADNKGSGGPAPSGDQPAEGGAEQPADPGADQTADSGADQPVDSGADQPADSGAEQPADPEAGGSPQPSPDNGGAEASGESGEDGATQPETPTGQAEENGGSGEQGEQPEQGQTGPATPGEEYEQRVLAEEPLPDADTGSTRATANELRNAGNEARQAADKTDNTAKDLEGNFNGQPGEQLNRRLNTKGEDARVTGDEMTRLADDLDRYSETADGLTQARKNDLEQGKGLYDVAGTLPAGQDTAVKDRMVSDAVNRGRRETEGAVQQVRRDTGGWNVADGFSDLVDGAKDVVGNVAEGAKEVGRDVRQGLENTADKVGEVAGDAWQEVRDTGRDAWERTQDVAGDVQQGVRDTVRQAADNLGRAMDEMGIAGKGPEFKPVEGQAPQQGKLGELKSSATLGSIEGNSTVQDELGTVERKVEGMVGAELSMSGGLVDQDVMKDNDEGLMAKGELFVGAKGSMSERADYGLLGVENKVEVMAGGRAEGSLRVGPDGVELKGGVHAGLKGGGRTAVDIGGIGLGITAEGWVGPGAEASWKFGMGEDGKFHAGVKAGASPALGGAIGMDLQIDTDKVTETARQAADFVGDGLETVGLRDDVEAFGRGMADGMANVGDTLRGWF